MATQLNAGFSSRFELYMKANVEIMTTIALKVEIIFGKQIVTMPVDVIRIVLRGVIAEMSADIATSMTKFCSISLRLPGSPSSAAKKKLSAPIVLPKRIIFPRASNVSEKVSHKPNVIIRSLKASHKTPIRKPKKKISSELCVFLRCLVTKKVVPIAKKSRIRIEQTIAEKRHSVKKFAHGNGNVLMSVGGCIICFEIIDLIKSSDVIDTHVIEKKVNIFKN